MRKLLLLIPLLIVFMGAYGSWGTFEKKPGVRWIAMGVGASPIENMLTDSWDVENEGGCWSIDSDMTITSEQIGPYGDNAILVVSTLSSSYRSFIAIPYANISSSTVVLSIATKNSTMDVGRDLLFGIYDTTDATHHRIRYEYNSAGTPVIIAEEAVDDSGVVSLGGDWYRIWTLINVETRGMVGNTARLQVQPFAGATSGNGCYYSGAQWENDVTSPGAYQQTWCQGEPAAPMPLAAYASLDQVSDYRESGYTDELLTNMAANSVNVIMPWILNPANTETDTVCATVFEKNPDSIILMYASLFGMANYLETANPIYHEARAWDLIDDFGGWARDINGDLMLSTSRHARLLNLSAPNGGRADSEAFVDSLAHLYVEAMTFVENGQTSNLGLFVDWFDAEGWPEWAIDYVEGDSDGLDYLDLDQNGTPHSQDAAERAAYVDANSRFLQALRAEFQLQLGENRVIILNGGDVEDQPAYCAYVDGTMWEKLNHMGLTSQSAWEDAAASADRFYKGNYSKAINMAHATDDSATYRMEAIGLLLEMSSSVCLPTQTGGMNDPCSFDGILSWRDAPLALGRPSGDLQYIPGVVAAGVDTVRREYTGGRVEINFTGTGSTRWDNMEYLIRDSENNVLSRYGYEEQAPREPIETFDNPGIFVSVYHTGSPLNNYPWSEDTTTALADGMPIDWASSGAGYDSCVIDMSEYDVLVLGKVSVDNTGLAETHSNVKWPRDLREKNPDIALVFYNNIMACSGYDVPYWDNGGTWELYDSLNWYQKMWLALDKPVYETYEGGPLADGWLRSATGLEITDSPYGDAYAENDSTPYNNRSFRTHPSVADTVSYYILKMWENSQTQLDGIGPYFDFLSFAYPEWVCLHGGCKSQVDLDLDGIAYGFDEAEEAQELALFLAYQDSVVQKIERGLRQLKGENNFIMVANGTAGADERYAAHLDGCFIERYAQYITYSQEEWLERANEHIDRFTTGRVTRPFIMWEGASVGPGPTYIPQHPYEVAMSNIALANVCGGTGSIMGSNVYHRYSARGPVEKVEFPDIGSSTGLATIDADSLSRVFTNSEIRVIVPTDGSNPSVPWPCIVFGASRADTLYRYEWPRKFYADEIPPDAPVNLVATAGINKVDLAWNVPAAPDVDHYDVHRGTASDVYTEHYVANATVFSDKTARFPNTYYYAVTATDGDDNESEESNEASATPLDPDLAPAVPSELIAVGFSEGVALGWTENNEDDFNHFCVYGGETSGSLVLLDTVIIGVYDHNEATYPNTYYYEITAVDDAGHVSDPCAEVSGAPLEPMAVTVTCPVEDPCYLTFEGPGGASYSLMIEVWDGSKWLSMPHFATGKDWSPRTNPPLLRPFDSSSACTGQWPLNDGRTRAWFADDDAGTNPLGPFDGPDVTGLCGNDGGREALGFTTFEASEATEVE